MHAICSHAELRRLQLSGGPDATAGALISPISAERRPYGDVAQRVCSTTKRWRPGRCASISSRNDLVSGDRARYRRAQAAAAGAKAAASAALPAIQPAIAARRTSHRTGRYATFSPMPFRYSPPQGLDPYRFHRSPGLADGRPAQASALPIRGGHSEAELAAYSKNSSRAALHTGAGGTRPGGDLPRAGCGCMTSQIEWRNRAQGGCRVRCGSLPPVAYGRCHRMRWGFKEPAFRLQLA